MLGDSRLEILREKILINEFLARGVDGLLIQSSMKREELETAVKGRMPFIRFGHDVEGLDVTMDRCDGAFIAVEHLITAHLHRKIGFVVSGKDTNLKKYNGYRMALEKYKIDYHEDCCFEIPHELDATGIAGEIIGSGITAVFCSNDFIAGYLIKGITAAGKRVPEDVAVVGFDGLDIICELIQPSLTSVKQPIESIANQAFKLLMQKLNREQFEEKTYYIDPVLRIGQSCGCR
jgi:DNA-binding LacI/PurR family transcriptional regulator